jgi:predicted transcriptional regulator
MPIPKKKKRTFQDQVLLHMMTSIKPYTLKGLASELRTTDVALQHLMLSLTDKGIVQRKEFGKKVKKELFWVDLEKATTEIYKDKVPTMEDMKNAKSEQRRVSEEEIMQIQILKGMESDFTNDELSKRLEDEEKTAGDLRERVQDAKDRIAGKIIGSQEGSAGPGGLNQSRLARFSAPPKKPKTKKQLNKEFNSMRSEWKSRKEKCMDFIDNLSDAMEKHPKEVVKILELETDENSGGVKIPPSVISMCNLE